MSTFTEQFKEMQQKVYAVAVSKGFPQETGDEPRQLMLIVAELAEALESLRRPEMEPDHHIPEFTELEAEMDDVVLRCMNFAEGKGLRLAEAMEAKTAYNANRPFKHGGKKF